MRDHERQSGKLGSAAARARAAVSWCGAALLAIGLCGSPLGGQSAGASSEPTAVTVGMYLNQVMSFSLADETASVDFYLWFRWDPSLSDPQGTTPDQRFEIVGAVDTEHEVVAKRDGYVCLRVRATIREPWDVSRFPLDNHVLRIHIEDSELESHLITFRPDSVGTSIGPNVSVAGWQPGVLRIGASETLYASSFGDPDLPTGNTSTYSRVSLEIPLDRDGLGGLWKVIAALVIAVLVCLVSFWIPARAVDPRFGLSVGGLFAAVASQYVVSSALPATSTWTLSDRLHFVGFIVIFFAIAQSAVALHLSNRQDEPGKRFARRVDRFSFVGVIAFWCIASAMLILWA